MTCLRFFSIGLLLVATSPLVADDWAQFRGPKRDGHSAEKGLLPAWPKGGPKLEWVYRDAGLGFASPSIVGSIMYTMGGWDEGEYVLAIDLKDKKELWKKKIGKLYGHGNWGDGPRGTVTVDGDLLFALGGFGDLVCFDAKGAEKWRKDLVKDLDGEMMTEWGYSESPLVDGDMLLVTPGGKKGVLAALDKKSGKTIWQSAKETNKAPYSSVVISNAAGVKQYIQSHYFDDGSKRAGFVSGFDAKTGDVLWTQKTFDGHSYAIAPTALVFGDFVYTTSGYGAGCHLFEVKKTAKGLEATDKFPKNVKLMKNTHGGVVLVDGHIYGHSETTGWTCQDAKTLKRVWNDRDSLECASGSIIAADGRLYLFSDSGEVALLEPSTDPDNAWKETGRFKLSEGSKLRATRPTLSEAAVWTHPVIADGRLYLRDQELIFCYTIKK